MHTCYIQNSPRSPPGDGDLVATDERCVAQERIRQRDPSKAPKAREVRYVNVDQMSRMHINPIYLDYVECKYIYIYLYIGPK